MRGAKFRGKDHVFEGKREYVVRAHPSIRDDLNVIKWVHYLIERNNELSRKSLVIFGKSKEVRIENGLLVAVEDHEPEGFLLSMILVFPLEVTGGS